MTRQPLPSKTKHRRIKPTVIILGDGKTEESYINRLKELDYFNQINLKFEQGDEFSFETKIKEHAFKEKKVIIIIDIDNAQTNSRKYNQIKKLFETKKYKNQIFFNNYAFELWLINHYKKCGKPILDKKGYDSEMEEIFKVSSWSDYKNENNRKKVMDKIDCQSIDNAVKNINELNQKSPFKNPSSNMDEWVRTINKIK